MREIVQKENGILRKVAKDVPIADITKAKIQNELADMREALNSQSDGVALAAPQIAISKRMFVVNPHVFTLVKVEGPQETAFINPKIIFISKDRKGMEEGCLSVRPLYGKVKRASRATVEAYNDRGEKFTMEGTGLLAQIFQHEIDHLDGILFIDKAKNVRELNTEINK